VNQVRDYFSYEHFYVIYCRFWEIDKDHDFLLEKDDLLKFDGHSYSRKAIDRIFSEVPRKFTSTCPGKMGYDDFCMFLLCDEDKKTDQSLGYFFSLVDLDGDGYLSISELQFFYAEQEQRLECLNHEVVSFPDVLCQIADVLGKPGPKGYSLQDFTAKRNQSGVFFSILLSLNKFLSFEQRDPFAQKQEQLNNPDYTDWDRFCADEYVRLAMEEDEEAATEEASNFVDAS